MSPDLRDLTPGEKRLIAAMRAESGGPIQSTEEQLIEAMMAAKRHPNRRTWRRVREAIRAYEQDFERAQRIASIQSALDRLELAWIRGTASVEGYEREQARLLANLAEQYGPRDTEAIRRMDAEIAANPSLCIGKDALTPDDTNR
jgi:hypothetical protein